MTTRRAQDHERQTGKHAKLPGAADARRVAGAPIACAQRFGPACAVRCVGIVPLLHQKALPPGAHMLRRRPRGVRLEALVPQEGQAQDAAERMEPARAPQVVVAPPAAKPPPPKPWRRGVRSGISELCSAGSPPLHGTGVLGYVRLELCRSRASWRAPRFLLSGPTQQSGPLTTTGVDAMQTLWLIVLCGVLAIAYAIWATRSVLSADAGSEKMQEIAAAIREGAQAYLKRQYSTIAVVGVVIFLIVGYFLGWLVAVGFAVGAILSGSAGFIGMNVSVRANVRTAQAATKSLAGGLEIAFRAGAITGMLVAGLALLGVTLYFGFLIGTL